MKFSQFDLFSSQFYFNVRGSQIKKGTLIGSILSFIVIILTLYYLGYLLNQYVNNQIEPNYKAQNFKNEKFVDIDLTQDLVAFRFEYDYNLSIDLLEQQQNKKYIVYLAYYIYMNQSNQEQIQLGVIKCQDPNLFGFYCLDFSKIKNQTLISNNIESIQSQIQIYTYGCLDVDSQKTSIPNNCANQTSINDAINRVNSGLKVKVKTFQYNTTSKSNQISYRNSLIYTLSSQQILTSLKIQKQLTSVKQGYFIQSESTFTSPLQYDLENQSLDRQSTLQLANIGCYSQLNILVDEIYQQIQIQYPTIPQLLALVNSIFSALMLFGFIARQISLKSIKKDFFMIFLQNIFPDSYFQILSINKLIKKQEDNQRDPQIRIQKDLKESEEIEDQHIREDKSNNQIPSIIAKSKQILDLQSQKDLNSNFDFQKSYKQLSLKQQTENDLTLLEQKESLNQTNNNRDSLNLPSIKKNMQILNLSFTADQQLLQNQTFTQLKIDLDNSTNNYKFRQKQQKSVTKQIEQVKPSLITESFKKFSFDGKQFIDGCLLKLKLINDSEIANKIKNIIFNKKIFKMKCKPKLSELQKDKIYQYVDRDLDVFEFYKDILFLKKAVMILLSQDQLASLQLVGCSSNFMNQEFRQSNSIKNKIINYKKFNLENNFNHYEQQLALQMSEDLQFKQVQNFLEKCQRMQNNLNIIDQRILSSIIQSSSIN
ncbi:AMP-binding enzyme family protein (macronuclear) [Tetrahymena thermophila SB210]|uniref:AMP-binding enzyme family protein n=1 Tax=Tetrahymena thermophila (strain SB210) TaxID=312017 RepID=Q245Z5_TETTS|nr:AMP-binding enzyme family protein [Tetrahymena thermophila SB210]EAS03488.2 AMP-binding enzyme family protein [Tetrahymena thermophila SB210]|eukprot:XP_001023733.2 AMP-binding enzyme family protein [Tetrahymena thermophila SB210]